MYTTKSFKILITKLIREPAQDLSILMMNKERNLMEVERFLYNLVTFRVVGMVRVASSCGPDLLMT